MFRDAVSHGYYWTGDVAGLYFLAEVDGGNIKMIQDISLAHADLAPLPRGEYDGWTHNGLPEERCAKSGFQYFVLRPWRGVPLSDSFGVAAVPARPNRTGNGLYAVGSDGVILANTIEESVGGDVSTLEAAEALVPRLPVPGHWRTVQ